MITRAYPGIMAMPLEDCRLDSVWSHNLDELIAKAFPRREAVLYGSRESFLGCYSGKHPTVLVKSAIPTVNATERRRACSEAPLSTEDFRIGAIYAAERRPAVSYQTIDIAVLDHDRKQVLLGARNNEGGLLRFIGGFVDPADQSLELAVKREAHEEAGDISIDAVTYLGSFRIDDWRYRANSDRVLTAFFTAHYIFGVARAHDDIDWVGWVPWDNFIEKLAPEHRPLGQRLTDHIKGLAPKEGTQP
jgi:bifunctional NMN adenylyltransferase/nudix hydrolase